METTINWYSLPPQQSPSGKEYPTYNKRKEGYLDWSHLTLGTAF